MSANYVPPSDPGSIPSENSATPCSLNTRISCSEAMNEVFAAMARVQSEMPPAPKSAENPFFKSHYSDLAAVHASSRPYLSKHGLCILQPLIGTTLFTILGHSSGQWIMSEVEIKPLKQDPQAIKSYVTYMRRTAEQALIGQASADDDDGEAAVGRTINQPAIAAAPKKKITPKLIASDEPSTPPADYVIKVGKKFNGKKVSEIPIQELENFLDWIENDAEKPLKGGLKEAHSKISDYLSAIAAKEDQAEGEDFVPMPFEKLQ